MTKSEAGRIGARITHARYGPEFYAACGRKGGRPKALTINDILALQANKAKGGRLPGHPSGLEALMKVKKEVQEKAFIRQLVGQT